VRYLHQEEPTLCLILEACSGGGICGRLAVITSVAQTWQGSSGYLLLAYTLVNGWVRAQ
jgi:hypothetical protein